MFKSLPLGFIHKSCNELIFVGLLATRFARLAQ